VPFLPFSKNASSFNAESVAITVLLPPFTFRTPLLSGSFLLSGSPLFIKCPWSPRMIPAAPLKSSSSSSSFLL